jgi:hypothetical protein
MLALNKMLMCSDKYRDRAQGLSADGNVGQALGHCTADEG